MTVTPCLGLEVRGDLTLWPNKRVLAAYWLLRPWDFFLLLLGTPQAFQVQLWIAYFLTNLSIQRAWGFNMHWVVSLFILHMLKYHLSVSDLCKALLSTLPSWSSLISISSTHFYTSDLVIWINGSTFVRTQHLFLWQLSTLLTCYNAFHLMDLCLTPGIVAG